MVIKALSNFVKYWYFRYLLVTELFMVEKWERTMFHVLLFAFLGILYLFNSYVMLNLVRMVVNFLSNQDVLNENDSSLRHNNYEL